jgi:hypothetical protein
MPGHLRLKPSVEHLRHPHFNPGVAKKAKKNLFAFLCAERYAYKSMRVSVIA